MLIITAAIWLIIGRCHNTFVPKRFLHDCEAAVFRNETAVLLFMQTAVPWHNLNSLTPLHDRR
jgi:hypothetical protein